MLLVLERTVQSSVHFSLAGNVRGLIGCIDREQRPERNTLRIEGGIGGIVAGERNLRVGLYGGVHGGRSELRGRLMVGEVRLQVDVGDGLLLNDQAGNLDGRINLRIVEGTLSLRIDADDTGGSCTAVLKRCNLSRWMPDEVSSAV